MKIVSKIVGCTLAILLVRKVDAGGKCANQSTFNCGKIFPDDGNTCGGQGCCCDGKKGTGLQVDTCTGGGGFANIGCESCWGDSACRFPTNMNIGSNSCHGSRYVCYKASDSTIFNDSCQGSGACRSLISTNIGSNSCHGEQACKDASDSTINNDSCQGLKACNKLSQTTIGYGSCNVDFVCIGCAEYSIVPDNACNDPYGADTTDRGKCNYCMRIDTSAEVVFGINQVAMRSLASCGDNNDGTLIMKEVSGIVSHFPALRQLKDITKNLSLGPDGEQTLNVTVDLLARGKNTNEMIFNLFLKTKLEENRAESPSCFTLQSITVVNRDDRAPLPSLKKKMIKSNKKQTPPQHKK